MNALTRILACAAAAAAAPLCALAVPAWPGLHKVTLADGTTTECRLVGDEYCHAYVETATGRVLRQLADGSFTLTAETADFAAMRAESARRAPARLPGGAFPTTGNLKGIILLVEFSDNEMQPGHDADAFHSVMNDKDCSQFNATGSARDYFIDQSNGQFTPEFDVVGPIKLTKKMSYYGANDRNGQDSHPAEMVIEACEYASKNLGVDFTRYDFNDDGEIDFVYIYYAGYAESYGASANTIWPHASNVQSFGHDVSVNGKKIGRYACSSELQMVSGTNLEGIGTFCHEFSHVLGQADHYNTRNTASAQLGSWDIMDSGSYNNNSHTPPAYSAFERQLLGWMEIKELNSPSDRIELPELTENYVAYRINTPNENEYFTLENRQQKGWDRYHPGKGLMIIHVAYDQSAWDGNYVNSGTISRLDLVEADGTQGRGQASDLFPTNGKDAFTDYTSPNSICWDGTPTQKGVSAIRDENGLITFRFMRDILAAPVADQPVDVGPDYFVASWSKVEDAQLYQIDLEQVLPEDKNPVALEENFSGFTAGSYPNADMSDVSGSLDSYMTAGGWSGQAVYQAGGSAMIGAYATSGRLLSPSIDLSGATEATVAVSLKSYPGKSANYTLTLSARGSGVSDIYRGKATKDGSDVVWHVSGMDGYCTFRMETTNERVFIDRLRILKGNVPDEEVWSCGPKRWSIDSIAETTRRVDGLEGSCTYRYTVKAMATDVMHASPASETIEVTTKESGIESIGGEYAAPVATEYFDLTGRRVTPSFRGFVIVRERYADGTVRSGKRLLEK